MKIRTLALQLCCGWFTLAMTTAVVAHHAFSMFEQEKTIVLVGEIREFQWSNPHVWVQLLVTQPDGRVVEWSIEGSSPNGLRRQGWTSKSLLPGMQVKVLANPLKSGEPGGSFINATLEDGSVLGVLLRPVPPAN
jgi:Family of unknown function (DUF6152)